MGAIKKWIDDHPTLWELIKFNILSNADFGKAVPKFIILAVVLVILSAALPAYSQALFINIGVPAGVAPTLANIVNILMQVIISYPAMKFWVMPDNK